MPYPVLGVICGFLVVAVWFGVVIALDAYWRMRAPRVVFCPTAGALAAVMLAGAGRHGRVARCSRWPAHEGCRETCLEAGGGK